VCLRNSEADWEVLSSANEYSVPVRSRALVGPISIFAHSTIDSNADGLSLSAEGDWSTQYHSHHTDAGHDVVTVHQCNSADCSTRHHLATLSGDLTYSLGGIPAPAGHACAPGQPAYDFCVNYLPDIPSGGGDTPSGGGYWRLVKHLPSDATAWYFDDDLDGHRSLGDPADDTQAWQIPFSGVDEFLFSSGDKTTWLITTRDAAIGEEYGGIKRDILQSSIRSTPYQAIWWHQSADGPQSPYFSLTDYDDALSNDQIVYGEDCTTSLPADCAVRSAPIARLGGMNVFVRTVGNSQSAQAEYRSSTGFLEVVFTSDVPLRLVTKEDCWFGGNGDGWRWLVGGGVANTPSTFKDNPSDCVTTLRQFPRCNQNFFKWSSIHEGHDGACACLWDNDAASVDDCGPGTISGIHAYEILWDDPSADVPLQLVTNGDCWFGGDGNGWRWLVDLNNPSTYKDKPSDCVTTLRQFPRCNQNFFKWSSIHEGHDGACACLWDNDAASLDDCGPGTWGVHVYEIPWDDPSADAGGMSR
jgi:hypothetical protein